MPTTNEKARWSDYILLVGVLVVLWVPVVFFIVRAV